MTISTTLQKLTTEQKFMISALFVNGGNYLYNLALGRILGPEQFADAAILITFLLVLSFVAMTFQLATAKFSVIFENTVFTSFIHIVYKYASIIGIVLGAAIIIFSKELQLIFNTQSHYMFTLFGVGVPIYFLMSVQRGILQGSKKFDKLATTYQREMISRLVITLAFLAFINIQSSLLIAIGISCSFILGILPSPFKNMDFRKKYTLDTMHTRQIQKFFLLTAFYELTQIIINNSDILLVKHYFDGYEAGLYASLALIGRVVYFVAWMFVMLLLPKVVQLHKDGKNTTGILSKYIGYIGILAVTITLGCYLFPEFVIKIMFGTSYMSIAPLLWKYALATSLFAISNIFAYYFLSLDRYIPVILSGILGIAQIALIAFFHNSLTQVVHVQILAMILLLIVQLIYFFFRSKK